MTHSLAGADTRARAHGPDALTPELAAAVRHDRAPC